MKIYNFLLTITSLTLFTLTGFSQSRKSTDKALAQSDKYTSDVFNERNNNSILESVSASVGYNRQNYNWDIGFPEQNISVLSELEQQDIDIIIGQLDFSLDLPGAFSLKPYFSFGSIIDGISIDSDFERNNRRGLFSRSEAEIEGEVFSLGANLTYDFISQNTGIIFTPYVGFHYNRLNLDYVNGNQIFSGNSLIAPTGEFRNLASEDEAYWFGPRVGLNVELPVTERISLTVGGYFEYTWYESDLFWNLRDLNFSNEAQGPGWGAEAKLTYYMNQSSSLWLSGTYRRIEQEDGTQRDRGFDIDLNNVEWDSVRVNLGVTFYF